MPKKWWGALHFSPFFYFFWGGVDEVGYFWGEVKIFSLGLGGGQHLFLKNIINGGGQLFIEKNRRAARALVNILTRFL